MLTFLLSIVALHSSNNAELLVTDHSESKQMVISETRAFGRVVGVDKLTGLFRLELKHGITAKQAKRGLRGIRGFVAIGPNAERVVRGNDELVTDHTTYIQRKAQVDHDDEEGDWWQSYQYWLHDRVNQDGIYDPTPFVEAEKHRDQMPAARFGAASRVPLSTGGWSYVGPQNLAIPYQHYYGVPPLIGRINSIAVDPVTPSVIYIASATGGVFKTENSGSTWSPLSDTWEFMPTSTIAIDPTNDLNIYVGTGDFPGSGAYGEGVMKSTNGGQSWNSYGASVFGTNSISKIIVDPDHPNILLATAGRSSTGENGGIFR